MERGTPKIGPRAKVGGMPRRLPVGTTSRSPIRQSCWHRLGSLSNPKSSKRRPQVMVGAAYLSSARLTARVLRPHRCGRRLLIVDDAYTADGRLANLKGFIKLKRELAMSLLALYCLACFLSAPIAPCHPPLAGSPSRRAGYLSA